MNRIRGAAARVAAMIVTAALGLPLVAAPVAAADASYIANCDTRLRTSQSLDATVVDVLSSGTTVTASGTVSGGAWSADLCGTSSVSGSSWLVITAVNGTSASSLYGRSAVYAAAGLFSSVSAPPATAYLEGLDVSKWQGDIDWPKVRASGRRFAIIKATEGIGYLDPSWTKNRSGAQSAGLRVGAYHFARPDLNTTATKARAEADWFVDQMGLTAGMIVPTLDLEVRGSQSVSALTDWTKAWLDQVYQRTGVKSMIYTSPSFWRTYLGDSRWFADNGYRILWVAHWTTTTKPSVPASNWGGHGWTFWQYTSDGTVPGIGGRVDLNRFNGTDLTRVTVGADFKVRSAAPASVKQGAEGGASVAIDRTWFTLPVDVSVTGLPSSVTASLSPSSTTGGSTTLALTPSTSTPAGTYTYTLTGTSNGLTRKASGSLTVVDGVAPTVTAPGSTLATGVLTSSVPVRTSWKGFDASGVTEFRLRRSAGGTYGTQALPSPTATSLVQRLASGVTYRYAVRAMDAAANSSGYAYGAAFKVNVVQQGVSSVRYSSGWTTGNSYNYSGRSARYATRAGAWVSHTFTGRGIAWVAYRGPNRGKADVYLDGTYRTTVDLYASSYTARPIVYAANWTLTGTHTIKIVVKGTAGHPRVDVDAFLRLVNA